MLDKTIRERILALMKREVVPAIGCTEPAAVALATAYATEALGTTPDRLRLRLSPNILKNAMGVGIPGTGMIGLPIAVALGALIGRSELGLEVLRDVDDGAVERGRQYISEGRIDIKAFPNPPSILHIEVTAHDAAGHTATAVISGSHTNLVSLTGPHAQSPVSEESQSSQSSQSSQDADISLNLRTVWDFATESPLDELRFILRARDLNMAAARVGLASTWGHALGSTIRDKGQAIFGDTPLEHMISLTSGACDARMGGATVPVMSNSGSGNQGITATMPVVSMAEDLHSDEEHTIRALALSHLTSIYIKQSLGRLSALCGCVVASTGASAGIVYLMGGDYEQVCAAIKNMVANLTGMICDGAKPSCSMKISSGVSTALMSAMLAVNGRCVTSAEGIVCDDVDQTVHNLTSIGRESMDETDRLVLRIMTHKC